jgi:acyl-CoA thioesterase-2
VDARTFLGLDATADPLRWRLPVTRGLSTPGNFLFGGCGLAAGIEALELASGRPCVWATAQYLSFAPTGSTLDIEVILPVSGHQITQGRAICRRDGNEILTVNAALGSRPLAVDGEWAARPDVPPPDKTPRRASMPRHPEMDVRGTIMDRIDVRIASGRQWGDLDGTPSEDGRSAMWARLPDVLEPGAAALAVLGDFVPNGVGQALGMQGGGTSLDNTIRMVRSVPTEWVLIDIRIQAVHRGFGHGIAHLWAQDGTLLATASQSVVVRLWPGQQPAS